jgi:hypothetical protein
VISLKKLLSGRAWQKVKLTFIDALLAACRTSIQTKGFLGLAKEI